MAMGIWEACIQFSAAALVIIAAGGWLTHCADGIAEKTGLGRLLAGSLFLAAATSLPEIMVGFNVIAIGQPDLAVGELLGSSLFNLLILMIISAVFLLPSEHILMAREHAVAAVLSICLTVLIGFGLVAKLDFHLLRAGIFPWLAFLGYLLGLYLVFRSSKPSPEMGSEPAKPVSKQLAYDLAGYITCSGIILLAAPYLADAAEHIARESGLGESFVGTTLVALSTSLPELVATVTAFRMRCPDLALGNIFGSNMFNMSIFLPLDWYYGGNLLADASDVNTVTVMGVVFTTGITAITLLHMPNRKKDRLLGNGFVVASILMVLWLLYHVKHAV